MKKLLLLGLFIVGLWFALANFKGLANKGEYQSIVLDFREDIPISVLNEQLDTLEVDYHAHATLNSIFSPDQRLYTLEGDTNLYQALKKSPLKKYVRTIEPNYIYHTLEAPNDPDYAKQWNFRSINVEKAWLDSKGEGVIVAVIDTGVSRVTDLQQTEFVEGYNFVNDSTDVRDDNGHGTHVAGTIAESTNNNYGVAGIAYGAKIMPLKVLSASGGGNIADIAEAIRFAADHDADIINMSLGGGGENKVMKEAIDYARDKGVLIVAAAGNSNQNAASYPARYPNVISVSALDSTGVKAPYSNFGAGVDISAPGGSDKGLILQETVDRQGNTAFKGLQGTSMASPHVAGVAALIKAAGIEDPEEVTEILKQSSRKVTEDPFNHFGAGQLDAGEAVAMAVKGQITFRDFFRWLRDNGYLNPRFWIDGGVVALMPKIAIVLGSYLLAWFLRNYFPMQWGWSLCNGLILGSSGLFFLKGLYIFDLPQWPFRVMGSSLPELGNAVQGTSLLNPIFASVLIPFALMALLLGNVQGKWFTMGISIGVASCLIGYAIMHPMVWGISSLPWARTFLIVNALLCIGLVLLIGKGERRAA
ncbi:MAG: S8 family peptidase [Microcystaceae cyanobacterium]